MSDDRWRLFVAVPLGDELRASLAAAAEGWRRRPDLAGLRWTDPDGWHVTVAFIGEVDPAGIPALARALDGSVRGRAARRLGTGALGGFPSTRAMGSPSILFRCAPQDSTYWRASIPSARDSGQSPMTIAGCSAPGAAVTTASSAPVVSLTSSTSSFTSSESVGLGCGSAT